MKKKLKAILAILFFSLTSLNATYPKVALVLSGGGAKGFAQIAVVEKIRELGIPIDFICGTSMGGLIGGYYALGYSSSDIKEIIQEKPLLDYLLYNPLTPTYNPSLFRDPDGLKLSIGLTKNGIGSYPGLLKDQGILSYLNKTTIKSPGEIDFDELPIPFKAISIDVSTGNEVILEHGYISDAMRATMSLPIIFPPFLLKDGTYCMDGGLVDNLPVQVAKDWGADIIISVDVSSEGLSSKDFSTLSGIIIQTINLTTFGNRKESQQLSDILVIPKVSDYMVLDVGKFDEIIEKGYEAFELNKEQFIEIRDEISKYRDLEFVETNGDSLYSKILDPLVTNIKIVDISKNNPNYSYANRFDKYLNVRLTDEVLEELEKDVQTFAALNNISSVTFNFNPTDKENNAGILEIGLRKWENSESKIDLLGLAKLGFSTNSANMSWLYVSFDVHTQLKDMLADKMAVDLKLNISESTNVKAKIGYQFFSERDEELTLFLQFGGNFGSLSPANNKHYKYYIPSFSVGFDVGLGLDFRLSSKLSSELLLNYSLVSLSSATFSSGDIASIAFADPILNILNADLSFAYLNMSDSLFSVKGYGINGIASIRSANGKFGTFLYLDASYNLPLTEKDTLKVQGDFGYSTANYQLTSSYFDVGGYSKIPGSYFGQLTREYFLVSLSYQRYLGEYIAPVYLQAGLKVFGYDSYDPMDNIYPKGDKMIESPSFSPYISEIGVGFYSGIGYKTNFGDLVFGGGFSINGNFCLVLEFV